MDKVVRSLADRKRGRDEAIVDFRHGFINRREFLRRVTAVGVSAGFALRATVLLVTGRTAELDADFGPRTTKQEVAEELEDLKVRSGGEIGAAHSITPAGVHA